MEGVPPQRGPRPYRSLLSLLGQKTLVLAGGVYEKVPSFSLRLIFPPAEAVRPLHTASCIRDQLPPPSGSFIQHRISFGFSILFDL